MNYFSCRLDFLGESAGLATDAAGVVCGGEIVKTKKRQVVHRTEWILGLPCRVSSETGVSWSLLPSILAGLKVAESGHAPQIGGPGLLRKRAMSLLGDMALLRLPCETEIIS